MNTWIDDRNAAALTLRDLYGPLGLDKFVAYTDLRKVAPFYGYVDIARSPVSQRS